LPGLELPHWDVRNSPTPDFCRLIPYVAANSVEFINTLSNTLVDADTWKDYSSTIAGGALTHIVSNLIVEYFYWVFLAILAVNLMQRRRGREAQQKRLASLYIAIMVFIFYIYAYGLIRLGLSDWYLLIYLAVAVGLMASFRKLFLPFTFRCRSCKQVLSFNRMIFSDTNLCADCAHTTDSETEPPILR